MISDCGSHRAPAQPGVSRVDKATALQLLGAYRARRGIGDGCLLCSIAEESTDVVVETPLAQVRLDRFGCTEGHLMIVPRAHVEHGAAFSWEHYAHFQFLAHQASIVLQAELAPLRVFVASLGSPKALVQSFPHFHIHVIPVFHADERARPAHVLSWSSGVTTYSDEYAASFAAQLGRAWPSLPMGTNMFDEKTSLGSVSRLEASHAMSAPRRRLGSTVRRLAASVVGLFAAGACSEAADPSFAVPPTTAVTTTPTTPTLTLDPNISVLASGPVHPTLAAARNDNAARPIVTGTLLTTTDGAYVFAADVDRDVVFKVSLPSREVTAIEVPAGQQPGRLVEATVGDQRQVFAALRAGGAVLRIDPVTNEIRTYAACATPRGLAYDASAAKLYVACEDGELLTMNPADGAIERKIQVASDLRDVQVLGNGLVLSRYRSAEVLTVDADGVVSSKTKPDVMPGCGESAVMHRLVVHDSKVHLAHQIDTTATLETFQGGYGSGGGCSASPIEPVVIVTDDVARVNVEQPGVVHVTSSGLQRLSNGTTGLEEQSFNIPTNDLLVGMMGRSGPLDLAVGDQGRIAITFSGDSVWPQANALVTWEPVEDTDGIVTWRYSEHATGGILTSVAFDGNGEWITQSREPAQLNFQDGTILPLDSRSVSNTGLDLFYVNTGSGLSCAGCHPEGDEDGRTWVFPQGMRRTQTLTGGVMSRAPFHWDGEMPEMETLMTEVMMTRMAFGTKILPAHIDILGRWLDGIPATPALVNAEDEALASAKSDSIEKGRALFNDATVGCASCHQGAGYTDNKSYDVGTGGLFYTPTLIGIGQRDAYMHDGCARTLTQRFGICGGGDLHGKTSHLTEAQIGELVAFMETL